MTLTKKQVLDYLEATEYFETIWQSREQIEYLNSKELLRFISDDKYLVDSLMDFYRNA